MTEENTQVDNSMPEAMPTQEDTTPSITLEDLANVLRIINIASERGAFKAAELSTIGVVYDRIAKFLNAAQKAGNESTSGETTNDNK